MSDLSFGRDVLDFWGLKEDTLSSLPLQFETPVDYRILVRNSTINAMRDIESQIRSSTLPFSIIVRGNRGSGKTTAMRYLHKSLETSSETSSIMSIYCGNINLDDTDFKTIKYGVHYDLLTNLVSIQSNIKTERGVFLEQETAYKAIEKHDIDLIDTAISSVLKSISRIFGRIVIFVDNLDKSDPDKYGVYEEYFKKDQGFIESLTRRLCFLFIAMQGFMASRLKRNVNVGYLMGGKMVSIGPWDELDLDQLLESRLKYGGKYGENDPFHLSNYFDRSALSKIYQMNDYNPRWVLLAVRQLMQKSSDLSKDPSNRLILKPIRKLFVRSNIEEAKGGKGFPEFRKFDLVDTIVIRQHSKAYEVIRNCMKNNEAYAWDVIYTLIGIWRDGTSNDTVISNILQKYEIVRKIGKEKYQVNPLILHLLEYLHTTFEEDLDSVRYYFIRTPP